MKMKKKKKNKKNSDRELRRKNIIKRQRVTVKQVYLRNVVAITTVVVLSFFSESLFIFLLPLLASSYLILTCDRFKYQQKLLQYHCVAFLGGR